jgi:cyclopropane-fatty-acyl-phospholipid synthase
MNAEFVSLAAATARRRFSTLAERLVLATLADLKRGCLQLELPDGTVRRFGDPASAATPREVAPGVCDTALIRVHRASFFKKCLLAGDIGFAESFMDGDWDTPDLTSVVGWFVLNHDRAPTLSGSQRARTFALNAFRGINRLGHRLRSNTRTTAPRNIRDHYDLSNDFFALWLDPTLMYSCARWESHDATLQEAQAAKNESLCRKLRLRPGDQVLEIGTGWGGWSLQAARQHGCRVTTLTLSEAQRNLAVRRIAAAGLADRIEVKLQDYRDEHGRYDKIVSIEMLEAVGHAYLADFAATCARVLKHDGLVALQFITCPDTRYDLYRRGVDFIQKHIFPGSLLLSINRLNRLFTEKGGFWLHSLEDLSRDYALTLRAWRDGFRDQLEQVRALGFDERFVRKWDYYLSYCEAAFALRNISVVQTVHTRPNNLAL